MQLGCVVLLRCVCASLTGCLFVCGLLCLAVLLCCAVLCCGHSYKIGKFALKEEKLRNQLQHRMPKLNEMLRAQIPLWEKVIAFVLRNLQLRTANV
jgi:hypothetical protein